MREPWSREGGLEREKPWTDAQIMAWCRGNEANDNGGGAARSRRGLRRSGQTPGGAGLRRPGGVLSLQVDRAHADVDSRGGAVRRACSAGFGEESASGKEGWSVPDVGSGHFEM